MRARVYVTLKRSVLDPQGKAIEDSLHTLGFAEVEEVRLGKFLELELRGGDRERAAARVDDMCRKLLANGVIEEYHFDLS